MSTVPNAAHAQLEITEGVDVYRQVDGTIFLSRSDSLYRVDIDRELLVPFAKMPGKEFFLENTNLLFKRDRS